MGLGEGVRVILEIIRVEDDHVGALREQLFTKLRRGHSLMAETVVDVDQLGIGDLGYSVLATFVGSLAPARIIVGPTSTIPMVKVFAAVGAAVGGTAVAAAVVGTSVAGAVVGVVVAPQAVKDHHKDHHD